MKAILASCNYLIEKSPIPRFGVKNEKKLFLAKERLLLFFLETQHFRENKDFLSNTAPNE